MLHIIHRLYPGNYFSMLAYRQFLTSQTNKDDQVQRVHLGSLEYIQNHQSLGKPKKDNAIEIDRGR